MITLYIDKYYKYSTISSPKYIQSVPSLNLRERFLRLHKVRNIRPEMERFVFCLELTFESVNPTI